MSKKLYLPFVLLMVLSMVLSACAQTAAPTVEATQPVLDSPTAVPATAVPTAVPPTEVPPPDVQAVFSQVVAGLPEGFAMLKAPDASRELAAADAPFLLDVRDAAEVEADGYIEKAVNIPVRNLLKNLDKLPGLDAKILVYCGSGHRGGLAMAALRAIGYTNVWNIGGGLGG